MNTELLYMMLILPSVLIRDGVWRTLLVHNLHAQAYINLFEHLCCTG
jgi:hypothetical protein